MPIIAQTVLHARYQVLRPIGRGGMGAVYEAIDLTLRNTVALKEMTVAGEEAELAFKREARLLAALRFPALPVVIDYFVEQDARFLVMQYIEGEDLAKRLERLGPCNAVEVLQWAVFILKALSYLHSQEPPIIHRDIKPANIKLTPRGDIVLLDFGLAKGRAQHGMSELGHEASIFGFTPSYAPPEQLEGRGTDPRSDLYALAATMYHLVLGNPPVAAADRIAARDGGRPDPLDLLRFNDTLECYVGRALELNPARRYASAEEMHDAITRERPLPRKTHPARRTGVRRLDAAAPSQAQLDRPMDLILQVRFADSPRLGLEDWPTARKPPRVEQVSEGIDVQHPRDPDTGRALPAKLRVKVVAPDFEIFGRDEHIFYVPPDDYSARLAFILTPRRVGSCRINVEVFEAIDPVYLGALPLETEALAESAPAAAIQTADLVLGVAVSDPPTGESTRTILETRPAARVPPVAAPPLRPPDPPVPSPVAQDPDAATRRLGAPPSAADDSYLAKARIALSKGRYYEARHWVKMSLLVGRPDQKQRALELLDRINAADVERPTPVTLRLPEGLLEVHRAARDESWGIEGAGADLGRRIEARATVTSAAAPAPDKAAAPAPDKAAAPAPDKAAAVQSNWFNFAIVVVTLTICMGLVLLLVRGCGGP